MKKLFPVFALILMLTGINAYSQKSTVISDKLSKKITKQSKETQHTVWVFFNDKGTDLSTKLANVENSLPANSIKRRKKNNGNKSVATFYDIPVNQAYINSLQNKSLKIRRVSRWLNAVSIEADANQIQEISGYSFVRKIEILKKGTINRMPELQNYQTKLNNYKSANYTYSYGTSLTQMEQINVPSVHDLGYTGQGVIICVLDAGFNNLEHQAFSTMNILGQYDFVNNDDNVDDQADMGTGNHGTMTLSTIGGFYEGQLIGPAFGASYVLAKTENTDSETTVEEDNWIAAMEWAEYNYGPDVTSTSLGYITFDDGSGYEASELDGNTATITIGADIAASLGIIVVNSAGNEGSGVTTIGAPADGDSVLAVGAVDQYGVRTSFSSMGPTGDGRIKPEVMAMGTGVYSAGTSGNEYTYVSGTSFSCPITAGAAALLVQMSPNSSNMEIIEALKMSANNSADPNNQYGWGIINVLAASQYLGLPQISHTQLNDTENFDGPYEITAQVNSTLDIINGSPILFYRTNAGTWNQVAMTQVSKATNLYTAEIPGTGTAATFDYYFSAENTNNIAYLPTNAPTSFFSFSSITDTQAPEITHNPMQEYYFNLWNNAKIVCLLNDNIGIDIENSFVEIKINGVQKDNLMLNKAENDTYYASLNQQFISIGDIVSYKITIADLSANQNIATFPESGFQDFEITDRISFEKNTFSHNWLFSGSQNWTVTNSASQDGTYSAVSGNVTHNEFSALSIEFTTNEAGNINFYKKVSSEADWDFLIFTINGNPLGEWSGDIAWSLETYPIAAGNYVLKWNYEKDGSFDELMDCAWIDNITLPESTIVNSIKIQNSHSVDIYPNPAKSNITINSTFENSIINIYSVTGKKVKTVQANTKQSKINISDLTEGIYFVSVISGENTISKKIIVE